MSTACAAGAAARPGAATGPAGFRGFSAADDDTAGCGNVPAADGDDTAGYGGLTAAAGAAATSATHTVLVCSSCVKSCSSSDSSCTSASSSGSAPTA
eukprot:358295-Chlamydomonas_euryale.AAC.3